jgi:hypothetical protein
MITTYKYKPPRQKKVRFRDFEFIPLWEGKPIDPHKFDRQDFKVWKYLKKRVCEIINSGEGKFADGDELIDESGFYGIRVYWAQ